MGGLWGSSCMTACMNNAATDAAYRSTCQTRQRAHHIHSKTQPPPTRHAPIQIRTLHELIVKPLNREEAADAVDALAKAMYAGVFRWVRRLGQQLGPRQLV